MAQGAQASIKAPGMGEAEGFRPLCPHPSVGHTACQLTAKRWAKPCFQKMTISIGGVLRFCPGLGRQYSQTTWSGHKGRKPSASPDNGVGSCRARWSPHFSVGGPPLTGIINIVSKHCDDGPRQSPQTPKPHRHMRLIRTSGFPRSPKTKDPKGSRVAYVRGDSGGLGLRVKDQHQLWH